MKFRVPGWIQFPLKAAIAGGLLAYVIFRDGENVLNAIRKLSPWVFAGAFFLIGLQMILTAWRWQKLLAMQERRLPLKDLVFLTWQGCFANLFLPAGAVGGDLLKIGLIASRTEDGSKLEAALSIFADRVVGVAGLFFITLCGFFRYLPEFPGMPAAIRTAALLIGLASICGFVCACILFFPDLLLKWKFAARLTEWADRKTKGFVLRTINSLSSYRKYWKQMIGLVVLSGLVMHPILIAAFALPLYAASENVKPTVGHVITASAFGNSASIVPVSPGGIGVRDIIAKELFQQWGAEPGAAATAVLVYTAAMLLNWMIGGIFFLMPSGKKGKHT